MIIINDKYEISLDNNVRTACCNHVPNGRRTGNGA